MNDDFREFDSLCARVADGLATDEEVRALDERLAASEAARRRYLAWMSLHGALQARAAGRAAPSGFAVLPPAAAAVLPPKRRWRSLGKIAAAFVAGGLGVWAFEHFTARRSATAARSEAPPIAQVVAREDARWTFDGREPGRSADVRPGYLELTAGELTLAYPSGATLTLQAPARARLIDAMHVFVTEGKLAARVPEAAVGFVVEMPGAALLDLGTSFSVTVTPDGPSAMLVREGKVMATLLDNAGSSSREYLATAGEVVTIDTAAQVLTSRSEASGDFLEPRALPANPLPLGPAYAAAVRASAPRAWWRFDAPAGEAVPNEAGPAFALEPFGAPRRATLANGELANAWAEFSGGEEAGFATSDALPDLNAADGYTLELWMRADSQSHATALGLLEAAAPWPKLSAPPLPGQRARVRQSYLSVIESTGPANSVAGALHPAQRLRYLHRSPPGNAAGMNIFSSKPYRLRQWHHLAAVRDRDVMRWYLDGRPAGQDAVVAIKGDEAFHVIVGRQRPAGFTHDVRPWTGALDEIAIYDRALRAEEIRAHYDAAPEAHSQPPLAWHTP